MLDACNTDGPLGLRTQPLPVVSLKQKVQGMTQMFQNCSSIVQMFQNCLKYITRHQMKVWSICASISVTITDIWTKFGTEHKYHTTNTPEWLNSYKLKIQDGGGRHLEFQKNVNNFGLDKDILHLIIWQDALRPCGDDHMTKSRNRNLIRVTSSNERLKHKCVDLSNQCIYFNPIWYRT